MQNSNSSMGTLGVFLVISSLILGYFFQKAVLDYKKYDRTVVVKGLSQKEFKADIALWTIKFVAIDNNLDLLYKRIDNDTKQILDFLKLNNFKTDEITVNPTSIVDKLANDYSVKDVKFRYFAKRTINIYSKNIDIVRNSLGKLAELGKKGIIFSINEYEANVEYLFTKLNEIKPLMIEEATKKAREVAQKFAKDSNSKLGKIKKARQGQFSIFSRDKNTQYMKKVRVVSTVEYYLSD